MELLVCRLVLELSVLLAALRKAGIDESLRPVALAGT